MKVYSYMLVSVILLSGCSPKQSSSAENCELQNSTAHWQRRYFEKTDARALVLYHIYGEGFPEEPVISGSKYRCSKLPAGISLHHLNRKEHPEELDAFPNVEPMESRLEKYLPDLAAKVQSAPECVVVRGEIDDPEDLDYLRDVVGYVTYCLDNGGLAVLDVLAITWYDKAKWRKEIFAPDGPVPRQHAIILLSPEDELVEGQETLWVHTRGMRKFARPDLSIRHVTPEYKNAVIALCNRFIEMLAFGGVVTEGRKINVASLPAGMTCHHGGDLDDFDFNNVHIEIRWPKAKSVGEGKAETSPVAEP